MSFAEDLRILFHLVFSGSRGGSHAERLERFYAGQAEGYDRFRERLLHGRRELCARLAPPAGGVWVDLGGGTAATLEFAAATVAAMRAVYVVDLSPSLLRVARERIDRRGWDHVVAVEADATTFAPPEGAADLVTFSYSLTMIPDWFRAVDHARRLLKPGGIIGVVDFYVSRKHPAPGHRRHSVFTRHFWPLWFAVDDVFLSADHVPYLHARFLAVAFTEALGAVPYIPGLRMPYYVFVGRRE